VTTGGRVGRSGNWAHELRDHGATVYEGQLAGKGLRIAIVVSRFNEEITGRLLEGAHESLLEHGVDPASIVVATVVCVGAVIRGETDHYTHVAAECAAGLQRAQLETGVPVVFGVLTTDTIDAARQRAGGRHGNKGAEAAATAVEMADLLRQLPKPEA
jgi:6,7-dimethyl-8-ribityllumazine synthase